MGTGGSRRGIKLGSTRRAADNYTLSVTAITFKGVQRDGAARVRGRYAAVAGEAVRAGMAGGPPVGQPVLTAAISGADLPLGVW